MVLKRQLLPGRLAILESSDSLRGLEKLSLTLPIIRAIRLLRPAIDGGLTLSVHAQTHLTLEKDLLNNPYIRWGLMIVGVSIGFLILDIMMRRPLLRELAAIKHEMVTVEGKLHDLVGAKDQAWETNNLLSALTAQKRQFETAKSALTDLREFRQRVEMEAQQTGEAVAALDQIVALQKRVAGQRLSVAPVAEVLSEIVRLHEGLLAQKSVQQEAVASLKRVSELHQQMKSLANDAETASVEVTKLGDLRTKVLENSAGVEEAQRHAAELIGLKETVRKVDDVAVAQESANKLVALKDSLQSTDDSTEQSQAHATKLLALRDEMASTVQDTQVAARNWAAVLKLESDMRAAGNDIAAAVETLEVLTDLGSELRQQTESIAGLRKSLMDVVMLETTIGRAMRVLEPLAQLKNLTRLSDHEVRAAARAILDQRGAKLSKREQTGVADRSAGKLPHEDLLFQEDQIPSIVERLVPPPRDLSQEFNPAPPVRSGE